MVTVALSGNVEPPPAPPLPPQPIVSDTQTTQMASRKLFRLRRVLKPNEQNVAANMIAGTNVREVGSRLADWALAEMVSWLVAGLPEGITAAGLKVQLAPAGKPEHAKLTAESNPFCGVTVTVVVCVLPEFTVTALGVKPSANVGGMLIV